MSGHRSTAWVSSSLILTTDARLLYNRLLYGPQSSNPDQRCEIQQDLKGFCCRVFRCQAAVAAALGRLADLPFLIALRSPNSIFLTSMVLAVKRS